jgi:aminoglycoside phosphotransferase (APT) family kinase protein
MHQDELIIGVSCARKLVAAQFPQWAELPIRQVESAGTDNTLFRLGSDLVIRMPRIAWAVPQVAKEQRWLPQLVTQLTTPISVPVALGEPEFEYPWQWSVHRWIEGTNAIVTDMHDDDVFASEIGQFVCELHALNAAHGPRAGAHNFNRGVPLPERDGATQAALDASVGLTDVDALRRIWQAALQLPAWSGPGVWVHGDLAPGNVLVHGGHLAAVIDFGGLGVGDPAVDMLISWNYLSPRARRRFRQIVAVDDATWLRGQAWALSVAIIQLPYYYHSNLTLRDNALFTINAVLSGE